MNKEMLKILLCLITIIGYFIIMKIKAVIIKKSNSKKTNTINFLINVLILVVCFGVIIIVNHDFDFALIASNIEKIATDPSVVRVIISFALIVIISITLYNTVRTILIKPYKFESKYEKRKTTIVKVALSFLRYAIYIVDIIIILALLGIDITPVLTGLGVMGIVVGLGAQKLITDFINGMFIIFERHFDVGDVVEVSGFKGRITDIGLKTTRIQNWKGEVKIIANSEIAQLTNFSLNNSLAVVEFLLPYDIDHQMILNKIDEELPAYFTEDANVVSAPFVMGITLMSPSYISVRVVASTLSETQYAIERKIRLKIIEILKENGIEPAHEHVVVKATGESHDQ